MSSHANGHRAAGRAELQLFGRFARTLTTEQGGPLELEPFQRRALADYFDGAIETLILLPKKNGKTTLLAALALYHLCTTSDAECVVAARSREQATILYDQALGFIRRSHDLRERVVAKRGYKEIRSLRDVGRVRVLAADVETADGVIPTLALVDELHRARSAELYGIFRDGLGPRGGRMIAISAAGDSETSPLGLMRAAARRLPELTRKGRYTYARSSDGAYALHEWALEPDDNVDDMRVVKRVNPASWQTTDALAQRHDSPSMLPWQWQRFACGIWVGAEAWWVVADDWHGAARELELEPGDEIALGFDGSRYGDATALVGCRIDDGLLAPIAVWEAPPGDGDWQVPTAEVDATVARTMETYRVRRGYFDPPLWQSEIDGWARDYGEPAVLRFQTNRSRMMGAVERFRTDLTAGALIHNGAEPLTRHVLNAQIREARGGYWLAKARQGSPDKIDLAVAAVLAYEARADQRALDEQEPEPGQLLTF